MKTFIKALIIGIVITLLASSGVLAAYVAAITVTESGSNSYDMLPVNVTMDNSALVGDYYITSTGLDTKVLSAGTPLPHMLAGDGTLFALPVSADTQYQLTYSTGNAALDSFYTIVGYDGYVTVSDDASLELGNNFEIEQSGYIDTSSGSDKNLVYKEEAFRTYVSGSGNITSDMIGGSFTIYEGTIYNSPEGSWQTDSEVYNTNPYTGTSWTWSEIDYLEAGVRLTSSVSYSPEARCTQLYVVVNYGSSQEITLRPNGVGSETTVPYQTPSSGQHWDKVDEEVADDSTTHVYAEGNSGRDFYALPDVDSAGLGSINFVTVWFRWYVQDNDGSGSVRADIRTTSVLAVSATGVSSGEHIVKTTADGTNLKMYIDDVEEDSIALGGASIPDNTNDWTLVQNNVMPYMEFYKHTVSATLISHYQPVTMILGEAYTTGTATFTNDSTAVLGSGTTWTSNMEGSMIKSDTDNIWHVVSSVTDATHLTLTANYSGTGGAGHNYTMEVRLPDRQGAAQDGAITWGSNPSGIAASVGALLPETQSAADVTTTAEAPSFAPETSDESWFETGVEGEGFPFYGLFKGLLDTYKDLGGADISMPYFWKIAAVLAGLMFGTFILLTTRSTLVGAAGYIIGFVVPATMGVLDWWLVIVYMMGAIPLCILSTKWRTI